MKRLTVTISAFGLPRDTDVSVTIGAPRPTTSTGHRAQVELLAQDATRALLAACGAAVDELEPLGAQHAAT